jgi:hypothetical protein
MVSAFQTPVDLYHTTWNYIADDWALSSHCHESKESSPLWETGCQIERRGRKLQEADNQPLLKIWSEVFWPTDRPKETETTKFR